MAELWFLGTAPLHNQCVKFQVHIFYSLEYMIPTKTQSEI